MPPDALPPGLADDEHVGLAGPGEAETRVLGSVFRARAVAVATEADVRRHLGALRAREPDATHHVSAFRLLGGIARADDDGEPSGTSGAPVLRQIDARGLAGVLVVVARWFGGTKLGTGGLVRAYGEAASLALDDAGTQTLVRRVAVTLRFDYADTAAALYAVSRVDARTDDAAYGIDTRLRLAVRAGHIERLADAFRDATAGRGELTIHPDG